MKFYITTLLILASTMLYSQDTTKVMFDLPKMVGTELTYASSKYDTIRGYAGLNYTHPQNVYGDYNLIHYGSVGYSHHPKKKYNIVFSYGIGIPLYNFKKGDLFGYYILGYHYREQRKDYRMRRIRGAYRTTDYEVSLSYTLRHNIMVGVSYKLNK